jgi:hypothetical protein
VAGSESWDSLVFCSGVGWLSRKLCRDNKNAERKFALTKWSKIKGLVSLSFHFCINTI